MGEKPDFPSKSFFITVPKMLEGEPFCAVFQKNSNSDKVFRRKVRGGEGRLYLEKLLCHSDENTRRGIFLCCV